MHTDEQSGPLVSRVPALPLGVTLRPYHDGDRDAVRHLTTLSFGPVSIAGAMEQRWGAGAFPLPWAERKWREVAADLERYAPHCLVAVAAGEAVIGCVTAQISPETGIGRIPDLMVEPAYQGQGVGRALLMTCLDHFRVLGLVAAKIETLAHNEVGAHLYPSLGFELIATQYHYALLLNSPEEPSGAPPSGARHGGAGPG